MRLMDTNIQEKMEYWTRKVRLEIRKGIEGAQKEQEFIRNKKEYWI